jgi:predicted Zn-dependent peptidase
MPALITTLANGMRVITERMDAVESVSLGVWVHVGTRHERKVVNGISHMLEHMAFKGTERRSARAIAEEIEAVGGHLNAYTSREFTAYFASVLAGDEALAVDIIADILQHSVFDEGELARERTVILQEIGQANDTPDDIVFDFFQETAFPDQPVGRPVLGTAERVQKISRSQLAEYMREHYSGARMVFAAAGKLDHDRIVRMVEKAFAGLGAGGQSKPAAARYAGGDFREERDLEQVHFVLGFEGVRYEDPANYALSVMSTLLGGGMSSRLFQEIREKRGLVYSVYSFNAAYTDTGILGVYAGTGAGEVAELVPVLCDELKKVTAKIEEDELKRARAQIRAGLLMSLESTSARAEQLARQLLVFGRPIPPEEINEHILAVDAKAARAVAERCLATRPTVAALGPIEKVEAFEAIAARLG